MGNPTENSAKALLDDTEAPPEYEPRPSSSTFATLDLTASTKDLHASIGNKEKLKKAEVKEIIDSEGDSEPEEGDQGDRAQAEDKSAKAVDKASDLKAASKTDLDLPARGPEAGSSPGLGRYLYDVDDEGNITSHDPALSSDPKALYNFLKLHSTSPPTLSVHITGTHTETYTETHYETIDGRTQARTETRTRTVTDFAFYINDEALVLNGLGTAKGVGGINACLYPVGAWEPVYRGGNKRTIQVTPVVEDASVDAEEKASSKWIKPPRSQRHELEAIKAERDAMGLPSFIEPKYLKPVNSGELGLLLDNSMIDIAEAHASMSFRSMKGYEAPEIYVHIINEREARAGKIQDVIDNFCASTRSFKELKIDKEFYGWEWNTLQNAIMRCIQETGYHGQINIDFKVSPSTIIIRPENWASKLFSQNAFVKFLLWIVLLYPILLLIELFLGDRYHNLRAAFPLARWRRIPSTAENPVESMEEATAFATRQTNVNPQIKYVEAPNGPGFFVYLAGTLEGEWFKKWENDIKLGVCHREVGQLQLLYSEQSLSVDPRLQLRGYL